METIISKLKKDFNNKVDISEKRPGIYQLLAPIYHEDGDMMDLFLIKENGHYVICDYGLTLQRLSYTYNIDTENKENILQRIILENGLIEREGNISLITKPETILTDLMQISQAYAKIGSMKYFKREVIESLFYEILDEYIFSDLREFKPEKNVYPFPERTEIQADYAFHPNGHPVFLFGIKDSTKAKLATITCLELQLSISKAVSCSVYQDFDKIPKSDRLRLTNSVDKQFTSIDEFKSGSKMYLERQK